MIDFIVVPHATAFPMACVSCLGQKGPLVDTHVENASGHVYVCHVCGKSIARAFGFAEGKELDERESALRVKSELEATIAIQTEQLDLHEETYKGQTAKIKELTEWLEDSQARVSQLEGRLRENAETSLSLVGGTFDEAA